MTSRQLQTRISELKTYNEEQKARRKYGEEVDNNLRRILKNQNCNDCKTYIQRIMQPTKNKQFSNEIEHLIQDVCECVDLLQSHGDCIVKPLLHWDWLRENDNIVLAYQKFLIDILSAHSKYLSNAICKLLSYWRPSQDKLKYWEKGYPDDQEKDALKQVHIAISVILDVIPLASDEIAKMIRVLYPIHYLDEKSGRTSKYYAAYVYNMFSLIDYRPEFTNDVLDLLYGKLVLLDTEIQRSVITKDDADDEDDKKILKLAETLDLCMKQLFVYIENEHKKNQKNPTSSRLFATLMNNFENHILLTHNTHHIQFSIFYYCSLKTVILEKFLELCMSKFTNPNIGTMIRQTSINYIASLLAGGNFVPISVINSKLLELCNWTHNYIRNVSINVYDARAHILFYTVCQAIFHIIIIRNTDLLAYRNIRFIHSLQLMSLVQSQLNPLNVCMPEIATKFTDVMKKYQILSCHSIMERNASQRLAKISISNYIFKAHETLDTVFPFESYLLKESSKWITPLLKDVSRKRRRHDSERMDDFVVPNC